MNDERKIMPESPALEERLRVLKETIPECFSEGRLDSDKLKDVLGEDNLDAGQERYGLNWPGKREARARAFKPSTMALHYAKGEGVNEKTTKNLIIEGENLEVLRLLLKPYRGRIKMIYIDPPYNTGNDFIYDDKFAEDSTKYEIRAGLRGEDGIALQTNRRSSGRYHSNWLSMIYPRLMLARELLSDDGILFISIDGNEEANLVNVASEIFGEENHICSFVWQKRYAPPPDTKEIGFTHESIIAFKKSEKFVRSLLPLSEEQKARYKNPDNDPRGPWKAADYTCRYTYTERPNLYYSIKNPNTGKDIWPKKTRVWANSKEVHRQNEIEKRIWWGSDGNNDVPALKNFLSDIQAGIMPTSLLLHEKVGHTDEATKELRELIPEVKFTPKPTRLIKYLMSISSLSPDSVVLDFFAGTGTTAQAVLEKNVEDGTYCQFVLVQIPEPISEESEARKAGYETIAEITKERIRRAIGKIDEEKGKLSRNDLGFRVFKLAPTGFKKWADYSGTSMEEYEKQLELHLADTDSKLKESDLVTEIMLREGFPLDSSVEQIKDGELVIYRVSSESSGHKLFICLDERLGAKLSTRAFERLGVATEDVFICRDEVLTDQAKLRIRELCRLATV